MSKITAIKEHRSLGITRDRATQHFETIDKFAGYGFNKSHAAAYALLAWQSSWLKFHHPASFYAAALTYCGDFDKMRKIIREARDRGITMLPPSLEKSGVAFEPEATEEGTPGVRWGLGAIKGLGSHAGPLSAVARGKGITTIEHLARVLAPFGNASTQARALAASGALDPLNRNRQAAAEHLIACLKFECGQAGQNLLFDLTSPVCPNIPDLPRDEKRAAGIDAIGISFDDHPLANMWSEARRLMAISIGKVAEYIGCGAITVLVRVESTAKSPRGATTYAKISDAGGEIEVVAEQPVNPGDLVVAEIARKTSEPRWRLVSWRPFIKSETPQRMRIDLKASHNWDEIRRILTAPGRGHDRIDIMVDLGERKARKVLPPCFTITPAVQAALASHPDVIEARST